MLAGGSFKVEAKRADKNFRLNHRRFVWRSAATCTTRLKVRVVDVNNPGHTVMVEVRDFAAYVL